MLSSDVLYSAADLKWAILNPRRSKGMPNIFPFSPPFPNIFSKDRAFDQKLVMLMSPCNGGPALANLIEPFIWT